MSAPTCLHDCIHVCAFFQAHEQGGGTQQHQGQPAAISCAWQSCQNALARPLSFRSTGHAFSHQERERWDLGGVFIHKDRQIRTKKGSFEHTQFDSASQWTGTPVRTCEPSLVLSHKGTSVDRQTEPGVYNLAFYKTIARLKLKQMLGVILKEKNNFHSSLNFLLRLTDRVRSILASGYDLCHVRGHEQTCLLHGRPNYCKRMPLTAKGLLLCFCQYSIQNNISMRWVNTMRLRQAIYVFHHFMAFTPSTTINACYNCKGNYFQGSSS